MSSIFKSRDPWIASYYLLVLSFTLYIGWLTVCPSLLANNHGQKMYSLISGNQPELIVRVPDVEVELSAHVRNLIELYQIKKITFSSSIDLGTRADIILQNDAKLGVIIPTHLHRTLYQIDVIKAEGALKGVLPSQIKILGYQSQIQQLGFTLKQLDHSMLLIEKGLLQVSQMQFYDNEFYLGQALSVAVKSLWNDLID